MDRRRAIWIVAALAAVLGAAAGSMHASPAARAATSAPALDQTYSCVVRRQGYVDLVTNVTQPPANGRKQPGGLYLTTVTKTRHVNGAVETLTQVSVSASKNSLRVDTSTCRRVQRQIPLTAKGLASPITITRTQFGTDSERCHATSRVLVRLQVYSTRHVPSHALLAVREDDAKKQPLALYDWNPSKVEIYLSKTC